MAFRIISLPEELSLARDAFRRLPAPGPYHDPGYVAWLAEYYGETAQVALDEQKEGGIYYPFLVRSASGGPLPGDNREDKEMTSSWYYGGPLAWEKGAPREEFWSALDAWARERGVVTQFIRFDPNLGNAAEWMEASPGTEKTGTRVLEKNRQTAWVEVDRPDEDLARGLSENHRRCWQKSLGRGWVVAWRTDPETVGSFSRVYDRAMDRLQAPERLRFTPSFFTGLFAGRGGPGFDLGVLEQRGVVRGGFVLARGGAWAYHYLSAVDEACWPDFPNHFLFFSALTRAREQGHRYLDFQGGPPGVFRFKSGFGPGRSDFYVLKAVHDPERYARRAEVLCGRRVAVPGSGHFPVYATPTRT